MENSCCFPQAPRAERISPQGARPQEGAAPEKAGSPYRGEPLATSCLLPRYFMLLAAPDLTQYVAGCLHLRVKSIFV